MTKYIILFSLAGAVLFSFSSCEGCVKKTTKKITKVGMSAIEGVTEAVDEKGAELAEKTTDAAGKLAEGVGRSIEKQLDEHATKVASVAGKTTVQVVDGLLEGVTEEGKALYKEIPYTETFPSGVSLNYFARYRSVVDAYFIVPSGNDYFAKFECYNQGDDLFLTKEIDLNQTDSGKYTLVSFALNSAEEADFENIKNVKITVTKK